jgi:hypothetical protein
VVTLFFMQWVIYSPHWGFVVLAFLHTFATLLMIIATRLHYTVDVILAVFITYSMSSLYFFLLDRAINDRLRTSPFRADSRVDGLITPKRYRHLAVTPHILNSSLARVVAWMDGLDLRWNDEEFGCSQGLPTAGDGDSGAHEMVQVCVDKPDKAQR